jgi:hypothetical protein
MLGRVGEKKPHNFVVVDLTSGYYQIAISEKCQKYTAFITPWGLYEWKRLPMGLKGAPAFFQRSMASQVLGGLIMTSSELYLDDLLTFGGEAAELINNFRKVLERFDEKNIFINPDKCKFGLQEVTYVGHTINGDGIHFSRERLEGIMEIKVPMTQKLLKSFLGLANYFRKHVRDFSIITHVEGLRGFD